MTGIVAAAVPAEDAQGAVGIASGRLLHWPHTLPTVGCQINNVISMASFKGLLIECHWAGPDFVWSMS